MPIFYIRDSRIANEIAPEPPITNKAIKICQIRGAATASGAEIVLPYSSLDRHEYMNILYKDTDGPSDSAVLSQVPRWHKTEGQPDLRGGDQVFNRSRDYSLLLPLE